MRFKTDAAESRTHKLATRVVVSTTLAGAFSGGLAAVSAVLAVDHMIARHAEQRVGGAADVLAGELDEGFDEGEWEPLGEIVDDENGELVTSGIRLAVYSGGHRIGGDPWVPDVAADTCATKGAVGERIIACGRSYRDWVLVGAALSDQQALRAIYASAGLGSISLGAAIAALAAWYFSRWALAPLAALSTSIRSMRPEDSAPASLGALSSCKEVALIRDALLDLQRRVRALLDFGRPRYRYGVIDVPRAGFATGLVLAAACVIIIVATQELAALRSAAVLAGAARGGREGDALAGHTR